MSGNGGGRSVLSIRECLEIPSPLTLSFAWQRFVPTPFPSAEREFGSNGCEKLKWSVAYLFQILDLPIFLEQPCFIVWFVGR